MFIETEETPNPTTLKFIPDSPVMETGTIHITNPKDADNSPLAEALFGLKNVTGVLLAPAFVAVSIKGGNWKKEKPLILGVLMDHFTSGRPAVLEAQAKAPSTNEDNSEIAQQIREVLEEKVRPAVARDGGDVVFDSFEDGVVFLNMQGACAGCPSAVYTLKNGIENLLKYYVPEVTEVRQV